MSEARTFRLVHATARRMAHTMIDAPECEGWSVTIRPPRHSDEQRERMFAMADELSRQVPWCGQTLTRYDWLRFATAKLKRDNIIFDCNDDGEPDANAGLVVIGKSVRDAGVADMSNIITWFEWMGAKHNVVWSAPNRVVELRR